MRWSCPHCGVNLAVTDEKLGTGWSFSRCYKCGGHALVRKSEINLIKVDKAPPGEKILLPEASEEPMLSHEATQNLARHQQRMNVDSPIVKPANQRGNSAAPRTQTHTAPQSRVAANPLSPPQFNKSATGPSPFSTAFPDLDYSKQSAGARKAALPAAIALAGVLAISSGVYLYVQGQALWQKARMAAMTNDDSRPSPAAYHPKIAAKNTASQSADVSDQVHHNAMAPIRPASDGAIEVPSNGATTPAPADMAAIVSGSASTTAAHTATSPASAGQ